MQQGVRRFGYVSGGGVSRRSLLKGAAAQPSTDPPVHPAPTGKAERLIRTMLGEWAYGPAYPTSAHRMAALARWLHYYNWHRRHRALGNQPPISRLVTQDDLLRHHS